MPRLIRSALERLTELCLPDGGPGACWELLDAQTKCLSCRARPGKRRRLCVNCFRKVQHKAQRHPGGWEAMEALGLAGPRAVGHGHRDTRTCAEPGCGRPSASLGLCKLHYERVRAQRKREATT